MLKLFGELSESVAKAKYARIPEALDRFRRVLETHLLEENVRLYIYLMKCLVTAPANLQLAHDMKREMEGIGRTANNFIRHYIEFGVDNSNIEKFQSELKGIGAALADRIEREEASLYTLYLPPEDYTV